MKKQIAITLLVILFILVGTVGMVLYGMGYRFSFLSGKPEISGTGLLVLTSIPDGASVLIDGHLTTATDNTLNLAPGEYSVKIEKEGYFPWEKNLIVEKEVVTKAEALLFPTTPRLESITVNGALNPVLDPSSSQLAYTVASSSAKKNGIYILDMSDRPILTLQSASTQIADDTQAPFSTSTYSWSPSGKELVATISSELGSSTYLLKTDSFNENPQDITATLSTVQQDWMKEKEEKDKARLNSLKKPLQQLIGNNFSILAWSADDTKILYEASNSATLPLVIQPRIVGINKKDENRTITESEIYVYDIKEDVNYKLPTKSPKTGEVKLSFMPDSKHILYVHDNKIDVLQYDGSNQTTIYAGPFIDHYVFPWTNISKVIILTTLGNQNIPPNLYTVSLK